MIVSARWRLKAPSIAKQNLAVNVSNCDKVLNIFNTPNEDECLQSSGVVNMPQPCCIHPTSMPCLYALPGAGRQAI